MQNEKEKDSIYLQLGDFNKPQTVENKLNALEEQNRTLIANLPKDDTYVEMNIYATNLTASDNAIKKRKEELKKLGADNVELLTKKFTKDDIDTKLRINTTYYYIREIINKPNGFQAIIFENSITNESTLAIAGSYGVKDFFYNPAEWIKDWGLNNLPMAFKHLPPQLETAIKTLDLYKEKYNITKVTGFSLGSILAGSLAKFSRNKDIKAYLYNGGLLKKLSDVLLSTYTNEINIDNSNFVTMLSKNETITNLGSIGEGNGIYVATRGRSGHDLMYLLGLTNSDYRRIRQSGMHAADSLDGSIKAIPNAGASVQLKMATVQGGNYKRDVEASLETDKKEINRKSKGTDTGLAADLFSEEEIEELKKRLEYERLPKETLEKMGEYHKRKFFERIRETYTGDFKDLTPANFIDKDGEFTFIPHDVEPKQTNLIAPTPKTQHTQSGKKDLSKDEKWQSFRKIFRTFFAMPDDNGKPMGKINSADVYNAIDVMETMKKAMHDSEVTQIPDSKGSIKDLNEFKFISDEAQTEMMQSALQKTSNQIKTDVKSEILDEISRQTMFPNREHVENIMRDVFDDVLVRRG